MDDACEAVWNESFLVYAGNEYEFSLGACNNAKFDDDLLPLCAESYKAFNAFAFPKAARMYRERASRATEFFRMELLHTQREFSFRRELIKRRRQNSMPNEKRPLNIFAMKWIFGTYSVACFVLPIIILMVEMSRHVHVKKIIHR